MGKHSYDKQERRSDLLIAVKRLRSIMREHLHEDELAGHHYVIPKEKLDRTMSRVDDVVDQLVNEVNLDTNEGKALRIVSEICKNPVFDNCPHKNVKTTYDKKHIVCKDCYDFVGLVEK